MYVFIQQVKKGEKMLNFRSRRFNVLIHKGQLSKSEIREFKLTLLVCYLGKYRSQKKGYVVVLQIIINSNNNNTK